MRDLGGRGARLPTSCQKADGSKNLDKEPGGTPGEVTLGRLTHTHRNRGPGSVYAFGRGDSVLVLVSRVAVHPYDVALLVPAVVVFFVFSVGDSWRTAVVFIWQTKYLICQNGPLRSWSQSSFHDLSYR